MTIKDAIKEGMNILKPYKESAWLEVHVLLGYVLKKERIFLISHDDEFICDNAYDEFIEYINKRISGIPLQYIIGSQEFMSLNFNVNPSVLIPRPETEVLVEEVIKYISQFSGENDINVLDIGTGSGCISISIVANSERTFITAVDISKEALQTAIKNAQMHGAFQRIQFVESNLFKGVLEQKFDVIVSNPPYISTDAIMGLQTEVKDHEPMWALNGGNDGLDYIRGIIKEAHIYLKSGGLLALEIGHDQAQRVTALIARKEEYRNIKVTKDYSGIDRVVTAIKT